MRTFDWSNPTARVTIDGHYYYFNGSNPRKFSECTKVKAHALAERFKNEYKQYLYRVVPFKTTDNTTVYMVYMRMKSESKRRK